MCVRHPIHRYLATLLDPPADAARAARMIEAVGGAHRLRIATEAVLAEVAGASATEARRIRHAFALATEVLAAAPPASLSRPELVVRSVSRLALADVEELWLVTVDAGLRPLGRHLIGRGGGASCGVQSTDLLRRALLDGCAGLFLLHNHPSGDPTPSRADLRFTRRLRRQLELLGIVLHDHIVVAGDRWTRCSDNDAARAA